MLSPENLEAELNNGNIDLAIRVSPTQKNIAKVFLEDIKASVKQSSL
jgi:hypothetical protein